MLEIVKVFRYCLRCQRWRKVGNFTHSRIKGQAYVSHRCRRCLVPDMPRFRGGWRIWMITDEGRRALRELEVA